MAGRSAVGVLYPNERDRTSIPTSLIGQLQAGPAHLTGYDVSNGQFHLNVGQRIPCGTASDRFTPFPRRVNNIRLPQELIECIIDFLHPDLKALCNCSLVCRSWYYHSQVLLYHRLVIRDQRDLNAVQTRYRRTRDRVLNSTRDLQVNARQGDGLHPWRLSVALTVFGPRMEGLQRLRLDSCLSFPYYHPNVFNNMRCFKVLVHLQLSHFMLGNIYHLHRIVQALPKLLELELEHGALDYYIAPCPDFINSAVMLGDFPQIRKFRLEYLNEQLLSPLTDWLALTQACRQVTFLSCIGEEISDAIIVPTDDVGVSMGNAGSVDSERPPYSMESIVRTIGPSLTKLVYQQGYEPEHGMYSAFDFVENNETNSGQ